MRAEKTVPRHDRVCHYCVTYKAPSRLRMPHTNAIASRIYDGYYKTYGKSDLPGTSRMQGYDRESPATTALNRALACALNIDRSIRGKREFLSRLESACVFCHRRRSRRQIVLTFIVTRLLLLLSSSSSSSSKLLSRLIKEIYNINVID